MAKYQRRKTHKTDNPSFQWNITDFNIIGQEYTIKNRVTGETRTISKEKYLELIKEQGDKK